MPATLHIARPDADEHIEYYTRYTTLVPGDDALAALSTQIHDTLRMLRPLDEVKGRHRYATGKWSVKEVIGHLADVERVFAYRALRFGRGDSTPLPGFDENAYVDPGNFDVRPLQEVLDEFAAVRAASVALFGGFEAAALLSRGTASDHPVSVRAIAWIIAGHELHHRRLLVERYGISA